MSHTHANPTPAEPQKQGASTPMTMKPLMMEPRKLDSTRSSTHPPQSKKVLPAQPNTKPIAARRGLNLVALREPPSHIERAGKQHR